MDLGNLEGQLATATPEDLLAHQQTDQDAFNSRMESRVSSTCNSSPQDHPSVEDGPIVPDTFEGQGQSQLRDSSSTADLATLLCNGEQAKDDHNFEDSLKSHEEIP
jgi:hypothetical protein